MTNRNEVMSILTHDYPLADELLDAEDKVLKLKRKLSAMDNHSLGVDDYDSKVKLVKYIRMALGVLGFIATFLLILLVVGESLGTIPLKYLPIIFTFSTVGGGIIFLALRLRTEKAHLPKVKRVIDESEEVYKKYLMLKERFDTQALIPESLRSPIKVVKFYSYVMDHVADTFKECAIRYQDELLAEQRQQDLEDAMESHYDSIMSEIENTKSSINSKLSNVSSQNTSQTNKIKAELNSVASEAARANYEVDMLKYK